MNLFRVSLGGQPDIWETDQARAEDAGATFDPARVYRYSLWRRWGLGPTVNFIMLNPSTADEHVLDPTLRRCMGYAKLWGMDAMVITNLFALRATDPKELVRVADPIGGIQNDVAIWEAARTSDLVVVAWGTHGSLQNRDRTVLRSLAALPHELHVLKLTKEHYPAHPLYLPKTLIPTPWRPLLP